MTEQERISREALLRRAVVLAGATYSAPALVSSAAAEVEACAGQSCNPSKHGKKKCRRLGGRGCRCVAGRCRERRCGESCNGARPCGEPFECGEHNECWCYPIDPYPVAGHVCVNRINFCNEVPECVRGGDNDCPAGMCCLDTCCPTGICGTPCGRESPVGQRRTSGSGPRPYLERV